MTHLKDYSDSRNKEFCIHCSRILAQSEVTRDHVPSKSLLRPPFPSNLQVVKICSLCNNDVSLDEEYFMVFLEVVLAGTMESDFSHNPKIARILNRNATLKAEITKSQIKYQTLAGEDKIVWKANMDRIARVVIKNARGHAMYELGEPMIDRPTLISIRPIIEMTAKEIEEFLNSTDFCFLLPEVGSRMLQRVISNDGRMDGWVEVQDNMYRYSVNYHGSGMRVKSIIHGYLTTEVAWN